MCGALTGGATTLRALLRAALAAGLLVGPRGPAAAEPPGIPSVDVARAELAELAERAPGSMAGCSRARFPHWSIGADGCSTRDTVLRRDALEVRLDDPCTVSGGRWLSPYDGKEWSDPAAVDVDHVVPLAEAWRSGASAWTDGCREAFVNDLSGPELLAVTDTVNQSKGDQAPHRWRPPAEGYRCTYALMWINVKARWELSVVSAERTALTEMLTGC